jgi:MHS family proline/betaine transporter-like MFS transporter
VKDTKSQKVAEDQMPVSFPGVTATQAITQNRAFAVGAGVVGNVLEWFDYGIYGTLAAVISSVFFPSKDPITSLLLTFVVFGVGFIVRPLGALVFGHIADKYGRKIALSWTITLMAGSTFAMGLTPSYASIGISAPILLAACRLLQGLSTGGEWGGATAFLVEYAPENRRGLYGSFQQMSVVGGLMLGSLSGVILTYNLGHEALYSWGWRIPFIAGISLGVVGWYIRRKLEDTPAYQEVEISHKVVANPIRTAFKSHLSAMVKVMAFSVLPFVSYYIVFIFMGTYINKILKLPLNRSLLSNFFCFILVLIFAPIMGHISDKIGRKPLLFTCFIGLAICTYPLFVFISDGNFAKLIFAQLVLGLFMSMYAGPGPAFQAEVFPTNVRVSTLSLGYNIGGLTGGVAPFIAIYLIKVTNNNAAPSFYVIAAAIVSVIALCTLPETYDKPLQ